MTSYLFLPRHVVRDSNVFVDDDVITRLGPREGQNVHTAVVQVVYGACAVSSEHVDAVVVVVVDDATAWECEGGRVRVVDERARFRMCREPFLIFNF